MADVPSSDQLHLLLISYLRIPLLQHVFSSPQRNRNPTAHCSVPVYRSHGFRVAHDGGCVGHGVLEHLGPEALPAASCSPDRVIFVARVAVTTCEGVTLCLCVCVDTPGEQQDPQLASLLLSWLRGSP